jgi:large repetitive protein
VFNADGDADTFVLRVSSGGELLGSARSSADTTQDKTWEVAGALAGDPAGGTAVIGVFRSELATPGSLSFDAGQPALTANTDFDVFLAHFDPAGALVAQRRLGNPAMDDGFGLSISAMDASGNLLITGINNTALDVDGNPLPAGPFLMVLNPDLTHRLSLVLPGGVIPRAAALGPNATILLTGTFAGVVDLSGTTLTSSGGDDVFVAAWSLQDQSLRWATAMGTAGNDRVFAMTYGPSGAPIVLAGFKGEATLGGELVPCAANLADQICLTTVELQP